MVSQTLTTQLERSQKEIQIICDRSVRRNRVPCCAVAILLDRLIYPVSSTGYSQTKAAQEGKVFGLRKNERITSAYGKVKGWGANLRLYGRSRPGGARPQRDLE